MVTVCSNAKCFRKWLAARLYYYSSLGLARPFFPNHVTYEERTEVAVVAGTLRREIEASSLLYMTGICFM